MDFEGMVVHYNQRWVQRVSGAIAICLGKHVFTDAASLSDHTLAHEYCHVAQYEVYGFVGYLVRWFYWTWKVGYAKNPFEQQAFAYADIVCPRAFESWPPLGWSTLELLPSGRLPDQWGLGLPVDESQAELWPY